MIRRFTKLSNHLSFNVIYQRHCIELDAKKVSYNLVDEIQNILSTIALEQVHEFMGYVRYSCHLYGFRSNSGL